MLRVRLFLPTVIDERPRAAHHTRGTNSRIFEYAVVAYGSALVLALVVLIAAADSETGTWLLIAPPVAAAVIGFATRAR